MSRMKSSKGLCIVGLEINGVGNRMMESLRRNEPWRSLRLSSFNSSNWKNTKNSRGDGGFLPLSGSMSYSENKAEFYSPRRNFGGNGTNSTTGFRISEEIREGVQKGEAIVALESAIITHGMPFPHNIETALRLQNIIRDQGAIPATIGVIKGQLTVGLSNEEIEGLGRPISEKSASDVSVIKVSRRDLPFALSQKLDGGTTVSGTIVGAVKAGIPIFATGGIGGVHRGAETSFDISADLKELGRNPIAVVSAGIKSILDIGKTLEYLESEGVCVVVLKKGVNAHEGETETRVGYQNQVSTRNNDPNSEEDERRESLQIGRVKFPSFFTAESQFTAPYSLTDELQAAHLVNSSINFGLGSGILIAVPIPKEHEAGGHAIETAVGKALKKAKEMGVEGKDMTPFILGELNRLTSGDSLLANKYLIENNVRVATQIAILLAKLRRTGPLPPYSSSTSTEERISNVHVECLNTLGKRSSGNSNGKIGVSHGNYSSQSEDHERFIDSNNTLRQAFQIPKNTPKTMSKDETNVTSPQTGNRRPVVIGGSSLDLILSVQEEQIVEGLIGHKRSKTNDQELLGWD